VSPLTEDALQLPTPTQRQYLQRALHRMTERELRELITNVFERLEPGARTMTLWEVFVIVCGDTFNETRRRST
jgi:hypothetical protein